VAIGLIAAGYADFRSLPTTFKISLVSEGWIPIFYAIAMGVDAVAALVCGRLFDRLGFPVSCVALVSCLFAPLVFLGNLASPCWHGALGLGWVRRNQSCARPLPDGTRSAARTAYGVFNSGYGLLWLPEAP